MAKGYRSTLKSSDTEEHIDIYFYRPMGYAWALLFQKLGVSPNTVTILSIFLGVGAGIMFGFNDLKLNAIGILLLIWANTYDSCDGQLARMTGKKNCSRPHSQRCSRRLLVHRHLRIHRRETHPYMGRMDLGVGCCERTSLPCQPE